MGGKSNVTQVLITGKQEGKRQRRRSGDARRGQREVEDVNTAGLKTEERM